jgi:hypothetical protein
VLLINTRRAIIRGVALLAAASLATACANPTGPADMNANTGTATSSSGVIVGSSSSAHPTVSASGVIVGSSS